MESTNPRILTGIVTSNKADKTITVKVERKVKHPIYGKVIKRATKVHAHDENNIASVGDIVSVKESTASKQLVNKNLEMPALSNIPQNLDFDKKALTAKVLGIIDREWIALKLNELFVIEFYSRKI